MVEEKKVEVLEGEHELTFEDGSVYRGNWLKNQRHGYGIYTWATGTIYEGYYVNGLRHG